MKKKAGSLLLAGAMLVGVCYPLAACTTSDPPERPTQHKHTYSTEWTWDDVNHWLSATCEHTEERASVAAHVFGDDNICDVCGYAFCVIPPEGDSYAPGDVVTSETIRDALNASLRESHSSDMGVAFAGEFDVAVEGVPFALDFDGEGTFVHIPSTADDSLGGKVYPGWWEADIGVTNHGALAELYAIAYLRRDAAYVGYGTWKDANEDYDALLGEYRKEDGPALVKSTLSGVDAGIPSDMVGVNAFPVLSKLAKNSLVYAQGDVIRTTTGYKTSVSLFDAVDKVLADVQTAVSGLKGGFLVGVGMNNKIEDLLQQPTIDNMMRTMLYGITAQEIYDLLAATVSEDTMSKLPETTADMDAFDYVWACLRSPEVAKALVDAYLGDEERDENVDALLQAALQGGIASVRLEVAWVAFTGDSFRQSEVVANIQSLRDNLKGDLLRTLFGENGEGDMDITLTAYFDETYALTSLDFDFELIEIVGELSYQDQETGETVSLAVMLDGTLHTEVSFLKTPPALADLAGVNVEDFTMPELPAPSEKLA